MSMAYESRAAQPSAAQETPLGQALEHVVEASQRVIVDRIELLRLETYATSVRVVRGAMLAGVGVFAVCLAWTALMGIIIAALGVVLPVGLAVVVVLNAAVGVLIIGREVRQVERSVPPPEERRGL